MKREPYCKPNPRPIFPKWFWKMCESCKMEFKNEPGWEYRTWEPWGVDYVYAYLCKECTPTQEEAMRILKPPLSPPPKGGRSIR